MTVLNEYQIEKIKSHMLHEEKVLKTKFKARNTEFDTCSVLINEVDAYEKMGYIETKRTARKVHMARKKDHAVQFEDDIWCLFYKLGFRIMNRDENLKIQWGPNASDTQQLDVVAVGEDAIFVVECKSAYTPTKHSFKAELNKIEQ